MSTYPPGHQQFMPKGGLVAWMCLCSNCGDNGYTEVYDPKHPNEPFLAQCETCNGTGREPVPWSEIFMLGRLWLPLHHS